MSASEDWVKYRIYCETEAAWVYHIIEDGDPLPTQCPNDTNHTVTAGSLDEIARRQTNEVVVQEESTKTGGHFVAETVTVLADAQATTVHDEVMYVNTSALSMHYVTSKEHMGDMFSVHVAPDTVVGALTAGVTAGDTVLAVSSTVTDNVFKGPCLISLFDGSQTEDLGRVKAIDKVNGTITIENAASQAFAAATPTYVRMTAVVVRNYEIGQPWEYIIGDSKIGGSYTPEGYIVRTIYTNRSPPLQVGQLTSDVAVNDTVLHVSEAACDALHYGDKIELYDGGNTDALGSVTLVDKNTLTITVSGAATQSFASATPTYVRKTAKKLVAKVELLQ